MIYLESIYVYFVDILCPKQRHFPKKKHLEEKYLEEAALELAQDGYSPIDYDFEWYTFSRGSMYEYVYCICPQWIRKMYPPWK